MTNMKIYFMNEAIKEAKKASALGEVPVGCVIVKDNKIIARGYNQRETTQNSIMHAEIIAIKEACKVLNSWRLNDCDLYVTLEPCAMCAGAILLSRINKVIFGASDPKFGSVVSVTKLFDVKNYNHTVIYEEGVLKEECANLLKEFFVSLRNKKRLIKK